MPCMVKTSGHRIKSECQPKIIALCAEANGGEENSCYLQLRFINSIILSGQFMIAMPSRFLTLCVVRASG